MFRKYRISTCCILFAFIAFISHSCVNAENRNETDESDEVKSYIVIERDCIVIKKEGGMEAVCRVGGSRLEAMRLLGEPSETEKFLLSHGFYYKYRYYDYGLSIDSVGDPFGLWRSRKVESMDVSLCEETIDRIRLHDEEVIKGFLSPEKVIQLYGEPKK